MAPKRIASFILCCALALMWLKVLAAVEHRGQVQFGGLPVPGVTVTARNGATGLTRTVVTESDGRYRLAALPPGPYQLKAELAGFGAVDVPTMTLTTGTEITRNVTMQVQGLNESVTVTGEAPIVEVTKTDVSGIIT